MNKNRDKKNIKTGIKSAIVLKKDLIMKQYIIKIFII